MANKERLLEVMMKVNPDFKTSLNEEISSELKKDLEYKGYSIGDMNDGKIVMTYNDASATINPDGEVEFGGEATADMFPEDFEESVKLVLDDLNGKPIDSQEDALNEDREEFKRMKSYLVYSRDGDFLGQTDPIDEEESYHIETVDDVVTTPQFQKFAQENNVTREQVGRMRTETVYTMNGVQLDVEYYSPSQSKELYDAQNNIWYNLSGQQMRDPSEYDRSGEGYTPFGDEGDYDY